MKIHYCTSCSQYTLEKNCPGCGQKTVNKEPAKLKEDGHAKHRKKKV
ncbi:MAG: ribosome biogenesis protein [Nanoarchaeota archaeon]|nr:ribosome biogenesis protein [Nanoarchaeota archaeon]